jgi:RNA polymerase sigma factor (sigma-70 family)
MRSIRLGDILQRARLALGQQRWQSVTDAQLLERFLADRDEAAFELLVWRHGRMVRNVCQRVLRHPQDVEDAFQATFLVFVRKARDILRQSSAASWLHKVAYRVALRARSRPGPRFLSPELLDALPADQASPEWETRELRSVLDGELNRLPEKFRAPLVLCFLEGKTRAEAARQLGCPEGTLSSRLARGQERLRRRLGSCGRLVTAGLAATGLCHEAAGGMLPGSLATATIRAALCFFSQQASTGPLTARAAALAQGCMRGMIMSKVRALTVITLSLLILAGSAGEIARHALAGSRTQPRAETKAPRAEATRDELTLNPERVSLSGSVVDAQGRPVAGAAVLLSECPVSWSSSDIPGYSKMQPTKTRTLARTTTDTDGRCSFKDVPVDEPEHSRGTSFPFDIVVAAQGHALAWKHWLEPGAAQPMRFVLPTEKLLRGRVTGPDGKPVRAAHVQVVQIARVDQLEPPDSTHADCVYLHHTALRPVAETDADGSFAVPGLPSDVRVTLRVSHDHFVLREVYAATTEQQLPDVMSNPRSGVHSDKSPQPILTGDVTIRLEAAGRLVGRVVYADTGKPAPRAGVGLYHWPAEYTANDEGRFAIGGLPPGKHHFRIYPPKDSEYLGVSNSIVVAAGNESVRDFKLPRGVPVNGRVLDEETGKGVAEVGIVYIGEKTAPTDQQLLTLGVQTGPDGRFRMAVPPGKGELFITSVPQNYAEIEVETGRSMTEAGPCFRRAVDVATGKEIPDVEFQVSQGVRINGRVLDPAGKPAAGATIETTQWMSANSARHLSRLSDTNGTFLFGGLREQEFDLSVRDRQRKLAARILATPHKGKPKQLEVQLRPMVKVTGCVRDDDGNPIADALLRLWSWDGKHGTATPYIAHTDAQGLFAMDVLVPGAMYGVQVGAKGHCGVYSREFAFKPGDTHTLADLTLKKANQSLAGVVVSKTGKPLAGVIVRGSKVGLDGGFESEARVTDAAGRFQLTGLPRGRIQVDAWLPWIKGGSFTQAAEAGNQNARIELPVVDK